MTGDEREQSVHAAEQHLVARLVAEGHAREAIATTVKPVGPSLVAVVASARGAYPGSGVRSLLVDEDAAEVGRALFGPMSGPSTAWLDVADLVRERGWIASPPSVEQVVAVLNYASFDALLQLDDALPPRLATDGRELRIELVRRRLPSGQRERVELLIAPSGPARIAVGAPPDRPPQPTPLDEVSALHLAIDRGDVLAVGTAMAALGAPTTPRAYAALARVATLPDETLVADALVALGGGAAAVAALREALADVGGARRELVREMLGELYGPAFAAQVG